tara:strand:- start:220 stop:528 length:309 start_codon:yes stop_codon:yes gene_type:complete
MHGFLEQVGLQSTDDDQRIKCPVAGCLPPHRLTASQRHPEDTLDHPANGSHLVATLRGVVGGELAWLKGRARARARVRVRVRGRVRVRARVRVRVRVRVIYA